MSGLRESLREVRFADVIAVAALFALLGVGFWLGYGMGLPTGGDALLAEVR